MRCEIDSKGTMTISATNELEAYALGKWSDDNFTGTDGTMKTGNLLIYYGPPRQETGTGTLGRVDYGEGQGPFGSAEGPRCL